MAQTNFTGNDGWFRQIFKLSPDPSWIIKENEFVECNDAAIRTLGYSSQEEFLHVHPSKLSPAFQADGEDSFAKAERMMAIARESGLHRFEWIHTKADGTNFEVEVTLSNIVVSDQQFIYCVWRDITDRIQMEVAQKRERELVKSVLNNVLDPIFLKDNEHRILLANAAFYAMFGMEESAVLGKTLAEHVPENERKSFLAVDRHVLDTGIADQREETLTLSGHTRNIVTEKVRFVDSQGNRYLVGKIQDITDRKIAERELRIAATAFDSQEGMMVTDADALILKVNPAFIRITGYSSEEAIGKNPSFLKSGRHDKEFYVHMWNQIEHLGVWEGEIWNRRKAGEIFPEYLTITAVKDSDGVVTNYVALFSDITTSKAAGEEIKSLAFYDPLTKLPNRRLLLDRLKQALANMSRSRNYGALLFLDMDNFKDLNDTMGHDIGDLLLQQVAERLTSIIREGDTVSRVGGDEFVVLLDNLSKNDLEAAAQAERIANKFRAVLNLPYQLGQSIYRNTSSIGITMIRNHDQGIEELLKQADIAMYESKNEGRNTIRFFDPVMQENINARITLENDLHIAINNKQFELYFQVQVNNSLDPVGAEALLRWMHPERGIVSPADFIPTAEATGLIIPIGEWVLDAACAQLKAWQHNPLTQHLVLSVNVSAKQFHEPGFVEKVRDVFMRHAIDPRLIKLEPTESILLENIDQTVEIMNALKALGVSFALDDFGTGFSSMQYLKKLPLNQLKIDQSFVRDLVFDVNDRVIVSTIIVMAQSLSLDVIAEGVEIKQQLQILQRNGCNHYQGYLFGKPVPIKEFEADLPKLKYRVLPE